MGARIVVIAEEKTEGRAVSAQLQEAGHEVVQLPLTLKVHVGLAELAPDMVIFDCDLADGCCESAFLNVRAAVLVPILVLGPWHSESFVVSALRMGADGCLCKPYGMSELLARVEAHLRRHFQWDDAARILTKEEFLVDELTHSVVADGREVRLTPTEYRLLGYLIDRKGGVATREELQEHVWGIAAEQAPNSLGLHIYSLRKKLERDPHHPQHIITKRGIGYYLSWKAHRESSGSA
jgi:two-component system KDP operon response regulator KdpE